MERKPRHKPKLLFRLCPQLSAGGRTRSGI